ncbi:MAG: hypothetical protein L0Y75_08455, partial [Acidobacteria bacterium]|nr:hypothetical protein [Acidobacteriota bacterium]
MVSTIQPCKFCGLQMENINPVPQASAAAIIDTAMSLVTVIANERSVDALNILQGQGGEQADRET